MPRFSEASNNRLMTCDQRLVLLFEEVISIIDCTVLCGARSKADQNEAYRTRHSKAMWPDSKHNVAETDDQRQKIGDHALPNLSMAVDVAPCPILWNNRHRFDHFAGVVRAVAYRLEIPIRWGGAWKQTWPSGDVGLTVSQKFDDLVHYELGSYA